MVGTVLTLLVVGFALALPGTWILVRLGHRVGILDSAGVAGHVKELRRIPNIGGIAIFWASIGPLAAGLAALALVPDLVAAGLPSLPTHLDRIADARGDWITILIGALAIHLVGLYDDRRALSAWPKLLLQVAIALGTALFSDVRLLQNFLADYPGGEIVSIALTVAWIVVVVNAVNFIDNMDGLAGGIAMIAALAFMVATILTAQWFVASALALLAGALAGFLVLNIAPARIFMGDGGSLFIGYMLATLAARTVYIDTDHAGYALGSAWYGVLMPIIVLAIPLYDGVYVTLWRIRRGKSPFIGGHEHISHRLVELGLSKRRAVGVIWLLTGVTATSAIGLGLLLPWQAALVGVQLLGIFAVMAVLETSVARGKGDTR